MRRTTMFVLLVLVAIAGATAAMAGTGEQGEDCTVIIDAPAYDETIHHDAVTHEETVIDVVGVPAQHYSLTGDSGLGKDDVPVFPAAYWQANTAQEPHLNNPNVTWTGTVGVGLHYTSAGSSGNRDWFYFQPAVEEQSHVVVVTDQEAYDEVVHHPAVTHEECTTPPTDPPTTTEPPKDPPVKEPKAPKPNPAPPAGEVPHTL